MIWGVLRRALGLPHQAFQEPQESTYAFKALMSIAASEIASGGEVKAARVIDKGPDRKLTHIGWMKRRLILGHFRKRG